MIKGVVVKKLEKHIDERGFFEELIRVTDEFFKEGFGQLSHAVRHEGMVVAWHYHPTQVDWWYVSRGKLKLALYDLREDSPTKGEIQEFLMGEGEESIVLKIPAMVAHGLKVLKGPAELFYITSKIYNPEEEGRISPDDPKIGYDWSK
jgi:dTDP-4-dehydrorhamnose 3,5-epimerase